MAKTLQQATGGATAQGVLPTAQEITSVGGVQTVQKQVGDSLAKDLAGISKAVGDTIQTDNTLSVNAAKRVAVSNLSEMSKDLDSIKANTTPDMDLREVQKMNEAVYQSYGNKVFENEDAQRQFDSMYHTNGSTAVSKINAGLEIEQNEKDSTTNFLQNRDDAFQLSNSGVPLDTDTYNAMVDSMTVGGYYTKLEAEDSLNDAQIQGIQGDYESFKTMDIVNADGTSFDMDKVTTIYNDAFGATSTMDINGNVTAVGDTDPKTVDRQQNAFRALMQNLSDEKQSAWNTEITASMATFSKGVDSSASSTEMASGIVAAETLLVNLGTPTTLANINKAKKWQTDIELARVHMDKKLASEEAYKLYASNKMDYNKLIASITERSTIQTKSEGLQFTINTTVKQAETFIQQQVDNTDSVIEGAMVLGNTPESQATKVLIDGNSRLTDDSDNQGIKSTYLENTVVALNQGKVFGVSLDESMSTINKALLYTNARKSDGLSLLNSQNIASVRSLYSSLKKKVDDGLIKPSEANFRFKTATFGLMTSTAKTKSSTEAKAKMRTFISDYSDANSINQDGFWNFTIGEDVKYANGTLNLITQDVMDDTFGDSSPDIIAKKIAAKTINIRGVSGSSQDNTDFWNFLKLTPIPFATDNTLLYTGGKDVTSDGISLAINQRIATDLGERYSDLDESTVTLTQFKDANGEPITLLTVRDSVAGKDFYTTVFTMSDFEKGARKYKTERGFFDSGAYSKSKEKLKKQGVTKVKDPNTPTVPTPTTPPANEVVLSDEQKYDSNGSLIPSDGAFGAELEQVKVEFGEQLNALDQQGELIAGEIKVINAQPSLYSDKKFKAAEDILFAMKNNEHAKVVQYLNDLGFTSAAKAWKKANVSK